jgi:predicted PurR-regulated permease PerM
MTRALETTMKESPQRPAGDSSSRLDVEPFGNTGRAGVLAGLAFLAVTLVLAIAYPFAGPLLAAAVLAGALSPLCERFARLLRGRRGLASASMTVAVALLLIAPIALLAVPLAHEAAAAIEYLRATLESEGMTGLVNDLPEPLKRIIQGLVRGLPRGEVGLREMVGRESGAAAAAVSGAVVATSSLVLRAALMLVALYFLLLDGPRFVEWVTDVAPLKNANVRELLRDFRNVSVAVLSASTASAALQAAVAAIGYLLADAPNPLFLTALTFVAAFIPAFGAGTTVVATAAFLYVTGHPSAAIFLALWGLLVVAFVDNLAKPYLMKDRMEVHGGVLFFALLGGLAFFGPSGLLAGPLIVAFFLAVVRMWRREEASVSTGGTAQ